MNTPFELSRLSIGEVLERTISLLRLTFTRIGAVFLIVALPAAVFFGVVMDGFMSAIFDAALRGTVPETLPEATLAMLGWIGFLVLAVAVLLVVDLIMLVCIQIIVCGEIVGRFIGTKEGFELTLGGRLWRSIAQRFMAECAVGLILVVPYIAVIAAVGLDMGAMSILFALIAVVVCIGFMLYLRVRWAFGTTTIAWEDQSILGAFGRSSALVRGEALRTFAILALFAVLLGVVASVIMTPFQLLIFRDVLMAGFGEARNVALQGQSEALEALSGVGFLYGITVVLASLITTAVKSVYLPVLYFDLRVRRGEFESE